MKTASLVIGLTCTSALHAPAQQADKAELYRGMLLKRPENAVLFGRFVDAWLANGEMTGLKQLLETKAADGGAMDWRLLAVFRNFSGDEAGAIQALDEALKESPDDATTRLARAKALGAALRFEDAMADLDVARKDATVAVEAGTLRGKFLARAGRPAEAVKAWIEVIAAHPGDEGLREDLIELEIGEGMLSEAVTAAKELAEKTDDPYQKALRRMRVAEILAQAGKKEDSVKEYSEVFAVSAEASWLEREVLARVNALFSREDDAAGLRAFYTQLRESYPRRMVVKKEAARSLMAAGESDEAVAMFREVLKVTPGDRDTRDEFIALLEGAGRFKDAADEVAALLASADKDAALWEKLAGIRRSMGDEAGLKEAVDKAVALAPEGEPGSIAAAAIYERYDRPVDAEKVLRDAVKSHGLAGEAGEALAVMLANRGKQDDAVALWQEMAKTADREGLLRIVRSLTAHGRAADAYTLLALRMKDFSDDPLLLAALCQAAQFSEKSDDAIPQALELVRQAKNPSDLETALRQATAIISRSEEPRTHLDALAAKADPSTQELCLLAELYESQGDSIQADKTLKLALAGGDPLLAAAQRVRLFEMRGDLSSAISATRDWLALPGGLRTEQVKRLVALYERSGDLDAALKETENWKRIAPGDKLAWLKRSELFTTNGQAEESVAELRRALAKFGTDEEMRAKLATSLSEAGLFEESWRMFYSLYDEADSAASKLKWVGLLAEMAAREGKEDVLIADFKRRSRDNPSSVVPLLAMAEMYRTWLLTEEESQAIEEASRRKPDDVTLLQRLADIEEKNGAGDKVESLLNRAIRIQDSPENRRRLAGYWMRSGEAERGLSEMLANGGGDPRGVEKLANSLTVTKDWETAAKILAAEAPKNPDDWRLNYLYADVLRENGQADEAFKRFATLLDAKGDLAGVTTLIPANQLKWMLGNGTGEGASNFALFAYLNRIASPKGNREDYYYGNQLPGVPLPGDVSEVRWMALSQALAIADATPETRDARLAGLQSAELPSVELIKSVHALDSKELRERLLAENADPRLFRWYIDTINYNSNPYRNDGMDYEVIRKGIDLCAKADPELALSLMVRMPNSGKDALGPDRTRQMLDLITALDPKKRENYFSSLLAIAFPEDDKIDKETRDKAEEFLMEQIKDPDAKQPGQDYLKHGMAVAMLRAGRIDQAVAMLNTIYQESRDPSRKNPRNGVMTPYGMVSYQQMYGGRSFQEMKFPEVMNQLVNPVFQSEFSTRNNGNGGEALNADQKKLLKLLGEEDSEGPMPGRQRKPVPADLLIKAIPDINDPILRVFMAQCAGKPDLVESGVKALEKNEDAGAEALQVAAAWHLTKDKDPGEAYQILIRARQSATGEAREMIDLNLYATGLKLAGTSPAKVDLEDARRAALRLRKPMSLQEDQKRQLAAGMTKLGLEEESKRYTAAPKGISGRQSPYRGMNSSSGRRQSAEQAVATLVSQGKRDMAARRLIADLRFQRTNARSGSNYEEEQLVRSISSMKLEDEVMKAALPPEGAGFNARRDFAMLLARLKKNEAALPLLRKLSAEKPEDFEVRTALLLVLPQEEQKDFLLTLSGGDFDSDRLGTWFNSVFERNGNGEVEEFLTNVGLLATFLEKLPPSFEAGRNLSWANFLANSMFENDSYGKVRLRPFGGKSDASDKFDEGRTKERDALAIRLYQAMLRHPQTSEQGFILMFSARDTLAISPETLDKSALTAFSNAARLNEDKDLRRRYGNSRAQMLWMWRMGNGGGTSRGGSPAGSMDPLSYLMRVSAEKGGLDPFNAAFLSGLEKEAPDQAKSINQCLAVVESAGTSAFDTWKESAKSEPDLISGQLPTIVRIAAFRKRADILGAALDFTCDQMVRNAQGNYNGMQEASEVFATIIASGKDAVAKTEKIKRITTALLGPKEAWELYGDRSQNQNIYQIQIRISAFQQLAQAFQGDTLSTVPFARFLAANHLAGIGSFDLREALASRDIRTNPAASVKSWMESGLLAPGPDLAGSIQSDGVSLIEQIDQTINNYGGGDSQKALGEILMKVDGPERFWARFLGAKLTKAPDAAIGELNANATAIEKWPESSRADLARIATRWFPEAEKKANPSIKRLLTESLRKGDSKTRELAETYLKDGFPANLQPYSVDQTITGMINRLIADDPALAAQLWTKLLEHFQTSNNGWSSSSSGYSQTPAQYVNREFVQSLDRKAITVPMFVSFVLELEKQKPGSTSGMFSENSSYYIRQLFSNARSAGKAASEKDKAIAALDSSARPLAGMLASITRETPEAARPLLTAMLLTSDDLWSINSKALPGLLDWIRKDLRKIDATVSDSMLLMLCPQDEAKIEEADKPRLRDAYFKLLTDKSVPAELRVVAEINLYNHSPFRGKDPKSVPALADLLVVAASGQLNWTDSSVTSRFMRFADLDSLAPADAEKVLAAIKANPPDFSQYGSSNPDAGRSRVMVTLAIRSGNPEAILRETNDAANSLRGDLAFAIRLWKKGQGEAAKSLLARPGEYHTGISIRVSDDESSNQKLPLFDREIESKLGEWLAAIEDSAQRYRVECLIASRPDAKEDKAPQVNQSDRIKTLVKRFAAEAPKPRVSRNEVLAALGVDDLSARELPDEYMEAVGKQTLGELLPLRDGNSGTPMTRTTSFLSEALIRDVIRISLERNCDATVFLNQLKTIQPTTSGNQEYIARNMVNAIAPRFSAMLIRGIIDLPAEKRAVPAAQALEIAGVLLESRESEVRATGVALAICSQAAARNGAALDKWLETLPKPEKEAYEKTRKDEGLRGLMSRLKSYYQAKDVSAESRRSLLAAILEDPATMTREIRHMTDITSIMESEIISKEDVLAVIDALPADHPRRAEFLSEKAGIIGWHGGTEEEALKAYDDATAAAAGDEKMLSYINVYRVMYLDNHQNRTKDAQAIAKTIKLDDLAEREQKTVKDILGKKPPEDKKK